MSSDQDENQFDEYAAEMPWLALDFAERSAQGDLSEVCGVEGIPSLALLNPDLSIVTTDARGKVNKDPKAETFPEGWAPALVPEVEDAVDKLNTETCLVVMCEAAGLKEDAIMESLTAAAKSMKDVYVEHNDADPQAGQDAATGQGERGDLSAADAG